MPPDRRSPAPDEHARARIQTVIGVPYFTPAQLERLVHQTCGSSMSPAKWDMAKATACGFIAAVSAKLGCPQRTTATAQCLYHRVHLFYAPADFVWHEVALSCLFAAAKLNDTLKKLHEFILAAYALQHPELIPAPEHHTGDWIAQGQVPEGAFDATALETLRSRLLVLERLVLQSITFDFQLRAQQTLTFSVKFARKWNVPSHIARLAWRIASDVHRTYAPLVYPPHTLAIASIYLAAVLAGSPGAEVLASVFGTPAWQKEFIVAREDVDAVAHYTLDLYLFYSPRLGSVPDTPASPEIADPSPLGLLAWAHAHDRSRDASDELMQAKIQLRRIEAERPAFGDMHPGLHLIAQNAQLPPYLPKETGAHTRATRYVF